MKAAIQVKIKSLCVIVKITSYSMHVLYHPFNCYFNQTQLHFIFTSIILIYINDVPLFNLYDLDTTHCNIHNLLIIFTSTNCYNVLLMKLNKIEKYD